MTFADVVKFTVYVTDKAILDDYFRIRGRLRAITTRRPRFCSSRSFPVRVS
jgi:hypothetical protein